MQDPGRLADLNGRITDGHLAITRLAFIEAGLRFEFETHVVFLPQGTPAPIPFQAAWRRHGSAWLHPCYCYALFGYSTRPRACVSRFTNHQIG